MDKTDNFEKKNVNPIWCPGCGLFVIKSIFAQTAKELGWNEKNTVIVSGIGCTGRISGYFNTDSIHTTHGRALPVAEGIKISNPKLNVVVISGDGDLLGIGGNHFLHTARRNPDITVICNRNETYGMTGGQLAPTTPKGDISATTPTGSEINEINTKPIITSNRNFFYARSSVSNIPHLKQSFTEGLNWKGFSYIETISMCITNRGKYLDCVNPAKSMQFLKEKTENSNTKENHLYKLEIIHS